ncbi:MAG: uracil-DNA glycosylase [Comamonadaceae bacterium]|nr:MAG: uracil-DNA glycosylase [Comamonadaceae bacterium]
MARPAQSSLLFEEGPKPDEAGAVLALASAELEAWPVGAGWERITGPFWRSMHGVALSEFLRQRLAHGATVYPPRPFRALELTAPERVKVVILGQDPYHGAGQAEGLAFSVAPGVKFPPSLRNIFKEMQRDLAQPAPASGSLARWAREGVLLLNTSLTVEDGQPASHARRGWEFLTDALLGHVAATAPVCVYMLWGAHAQAKAPLIEAAAATAGRQALILQANHPSPLSALRPPVPFIGCGHFSQARAWLGRHGVSIDWALDPA